MCRRSSTPWNHPSADSCPPLFCPPRWGTPQVPRGLYLKKMTWLIRAFVCVCSWVGPRMPMAQKEHWSQHMRADGDKSHQSLDDIRAAYQAQHGSELASSWHRIEATGALVSLASHARRPDATRACRILVAKRAPKPGLNFSRAHRRGRTWALCPRLPFRFMAVPVASTRSSHFPGQPDRWLACAPSGGLWQTHDAGESWSVFGIDALAPLGASDAWIDPNNLDHVWLATGDSNGGDTYSIGILETWDAGATWSPLSLGLAVENQQRVHVLRHTLPQPDGFGWAEIWGLFTTDDGGETFALQSFGSAVRDIVWMSDSTVVLALEDQGVIRSTDGGASWTTPACLPIWKVWGAFNLQVNRGTGLTSATRCTPWPATTCNKTSWDSGEVQTPGPLGRRWPPRPLVPTCSAWLSTARTTWDKPSGICAWR